MDEFWSVFFFGGNFFLDDEEASSSWLFSWWFDALLWETPHRFVDLFLEFWISVDGLAVDTISVDSCWSTNKLPVGWLTLTAIWFLLKWLMWLQSSSSLSFVSSEIIFSSTSNYDALHQLILEFSYHIKQHELIP